MFYSHKFLNNNAFYYLLDFCVISESENILSWFELVYLKILVPNPKLLQNIFTKQYLPNFLQRIFVSCISIRRLECWQLTQTAYQVVSIFNKDICFFMYRFSTITKWSKLFCTFYKALCSPILFWLHIKFYHVFSSKDFSKYVISPHFQSILYVW